MNGRPLHPPALASEPISTTQIKLTWDAATGANGYQLQRATSAGGACTEIGGTLTNTDYIDTNMIAGTRYHYVIRALFDNGVESRISTQVSSVPSAPLTATDSSHKARLFV
jgi:mannan endo-1,4-beta-mannosidase